MKLGILFSVISLLLAVAAFTHQGWFLLLLWPALSTALVAGAYLGLGPGIYGKSLDGRLSLVSVAVLLPYLLYSRCAWYLLRLVRREPAWNELVDGILIGRRLLNREFPDVVDYVVDLTCEFAEPSAARTRSYYSFQILDASVPRLDQLQNWIADVARLSGTVYIHCAEGHGRTGLFAAALLLHRGDCRTAEEALTFARSKRPLVRLTGPQREMLLRFQKQIDAASSMSS